MTDQIVSFLKDCLKNDNIEVYSNKVLSNGIKGKLYSYQEGHVIRLITILLKYHIALDNSDTGVGKTIMAIAVAWELNKRPFIICPKSVMYNWLNVCNYIGINYIDIVNLETIKYGRTYISTKFKARKKSKYFNISDGNYEWNLPSDVMIIIDEAHRCKTYKTDNGKFLVSMKQLIQLKIPVLLLSATICEKISDMKIIFYLFDLINEIRYFNKYCRMIKNKYPQFRISRKNYIKRSDYQNACDNANALILSEEIKNFNSRIKIKDLGDKFPSNQWCAQQFVADEAAEIERAYAEISICFEKLKNNLSGNHLAMIQKLKQEIELKKIPIFIEQAQLLLEDRKSVIIFANYLDTINILCKILNIKCKVVGDQTAEERQRAIDLFQINHEKIIILQVKAGNVGISLHDIYGNHPRAVLLNFPDSAADLLQALGRAPRVGAKTPVIQRIVCVANVEYEKNIMQNINRKLTNISCINDRDLNGYKYNINNGVRKNEKNKDYV
uniref:Helicase n=1 Tax=viral metagenome TaxID=1070528 RepID=A0A6C0LTA0_9ZZZZ